MAFSELERKRIEQAIGAFCGKHSPLHLRDKLHLTYTVNLKTYITPPLLTDSAAG
jgi:hypothetical protein